MELCEDSKGEQQQQPPRRTRLLVVMGCIRTKMDPLANPHYRGTWSEV